MKAINNLSTPVKKVNEPLTNVSFYLVHPDDPEAKPSNSIAYQVIVKKGFGSARNGLTSTETECIRLCLTGHSQRRIASTLNIPAETVKDIFTSLSQRFCGSKADSLFDGLLDAGLLFRKTPPWENEDDHDLEECNNHCVVEGVAS